MMRLGYQRFPCARLNILGTASVSGQKTYLPRNPYVTSRQQSFSNSKKKPNLPNKFRQPSTQSPPPPPTIPPIVTQKQIWWNEVCGTSYQTQTAQSGVRIYTFAVRPPIPSLRKSTVFARKCSIEIFEECFTIAQKAKISMHPKGEDDIPGVVITGNPGIGKSCTAAYFLVELQKRGITAIYGALGGNEFIIFHPDGRVQGELSFSAAEDMVPLDAWVLLDGSAGATDMRLSENKLHTVIFTSPKTTVYKQFLRHGAKHLYMPTWELKELEDVAVHLNLTKEEIQHRYKSAGGIIRYIGSEKDEQQTRERMQSAMNNTTLVDLARLLAQPNHKYLDINFVKSVSLSMLKIVPNQNYREYNLKFLNELAREIAIERIPMLDQSQKIAAYGFSIGNDNTLAGLLYQTVLLPQLQVGGTFQYKRMQITKSSVRVANDEESVRTVIPALQRIKSQDSDYAVLKSMGASHCYIPVASNHPVFDMYFVGTEENSICGVQTTINAEHSLKIRPFIKLLKGLDFGAADVQRKFIYYLVCDGPDNKDFHLKVVYGKPAAKTKDTDGVKKEGQGKAVVHRRIRREIKGTNGDKNVGQDTDQGKEDNKVQDEMKPEDIEFIKKYVEFRRISWKLSSFQTPLEYIAQIQK